ncbi:uncharacterized protein LOC131980289 [Centropristis striata]|uniref:uncharacterized protein LOC131980289 n=1 Tax=Centropristis striata TaxID=184440 RepID=UPI0027E0C7B6|nr:uncharacterized protein LOC131980289 [Centropristis striata]
MAAPQKFVLRVCVATDLAMKLILTERPQSVEELKNIMQEKFKPRLDCDPDFDGQLSVLMDIQELPEKGTLKVVSSESVCRVSSHYKCESSNQFYCELDRYTPKLVALYRQKSSRTGKGAEALREMLRIYDLEEEHDINMRRTLALHGLPVYLREDDTEFYKTCNGEDEMETTDTPLAFLSVAPDSTGSSSFSPENISIVIEDEVVMSELPRLADAFVVLLGLSYALHLDYPKKLTHTFSFIQKVLLCLDDNKALNPCLLSLKNELLKE